MPSDLEPRVRVVALHVHPVKSCRGIQVQAASVDARGLTLDRRFMIVDARGDFVTQRNEPRLALIDTALEDDVLVLAAPVLAPGLAPLRVPCSPTGESTRVRVWADHVDAVDVGEDAARWLHQALGLPSLRLVHMPDTTRRLVDHPAAPTAIVGFADAFPFLVISAASLAAVEARAPGTGVARRFRPNLVLDGLDAFAEDTLAGVAIGDLVLRFVRPCSRCVMVDVDPETGVVGREPLASLATYRRQGGSVMFGQNAVHDRAGTLRVGDVARALPSYHGG